MEGSTRRIVAMLLWLSGRAITIYAAICASQHVMTAIALSSFPTHNANHFTSEALLNKIHTERSQ